NGDFTHRSMTHVSELLNSDRAEAVLRKRGLDGVLAVLPENWLYLTGHEDRVASTIGLPVLALLTRRPPGVKAIALPRLVAALAAAQMPKLDEIVLYGEFPVNVSEVELSGLERATVELLEDQSRAVATVADAVELILRLGGLDRAQIA